MLTCIECCLNTVISTTLNYSIGFDISLTMWHIQPKDMNDTFLSVTLLSQRRFSQCLVFINFISSNYITRVQLTCLHVQILWFLFSKAFIFLKTIFTVAVSFVGKYTVAHFWLMETGIILTHSSIILSLLFGCLHVFALALWKVLRFILKSDNPLGCLEKKTHPFRVLLIIICLWGHKVSLCLMSIWVIHLFTIFFGRLQHM